MAERGQSLEGKPVFGSPVREQKTTRSKTIGEVAPNFPKETQLVLDPKSHEEQYVKPELTRKPPRLDTKAGRKRMEKLLGDQDRVTRTLFAQDRLRRTGR